VAQALRLAYAIALALGDVRAIVLRPEGGFELMDNGIASRQNLPDNIRFLAAQRHIYSRAKRLAAVQAFLAGLTPIVGAIAVALKPEADVWAALAGIIVAFVDTVWLDPKQNNLRNFAANVQEYFDCNVLQLTCNDPLAGRHPSPEDIHEAAEAYTPASAAPLEDWYPRIVSSVPLFQGRVICQRTNCWWDSKLRQRYGTWILSTVSVLSLFVFVLGFVGDVSLQKFVLAVMAPLLPAALWAAREYRRQIETAEESDRVRDYSESLWSQIVSGELTEPEVSRRSRALQDAILVRRREGAPVFDWVYRRLRKGYEEQMQVGAQVMVEQISIRKGTTGPALQ
jgi:hypothetical protein